MKVFTDRGKIIITNIPDYPKKIVIPSQLFPLSGAIEIFHSNNTEDCPDEQLRQIFDQTAASIGFCYTNTENLAHNLIAAAIPKERYKTYVGWLFPGDILPIHHSFIVVDNKYMLDFSVNKKYSDPAYIEELYKKYGDIGQDELRENLAAEFIKDSTKSNSQIGTFGQVAQNYLYIASRCKPQHGKTIYNHLVKSHPNHPCIRTATSFGATDMQLRIIQKGGILGEKRNNRN